MTAGPDPRVLTGLGDRIRDARRVTILTGAGVSAASGVPTFRGPGGLWRSFRSEDLATPEAFHRNPELVWQWYDWRRSVLAKARPNPAHDVLARLSRRIGVTLITQNVDGLHELAGSRDVVRLHGSIWQLRCLVGCGEPPASWEDRRTPLPELPPRCQACGGYARPAVVWFGEAIDTAVLTRSMEATACDVYLSIGTSSLVHPAAGLVRLAKSRGAYTVEINPVATDATPYLDLALALPAEQALSALGI